MNTWWNEDYVEDFDRVMDVIQSTPGVNEENYEPFLMHVATSMRNPRNLTKIQPDTARFMFEHWPEKHHYNKPHLMRGVVPDSGKLGSGQLTPTITLSSEFLYRPGSFYLGRTIENDLVQFGAGEDTELHSAPLGHSGDGHIFLCAETQWGKTKRILISNLALWPGSAFVIDCKGELAAITAQRRGQGAYRKIPKDGSEPDGLFYNGLPPDNDEDNYIEIVCNGMGQNVHVLDPKGISDLLGEKDLDAAYGSRINPLDIIDANDPETIDFARELAEALIIDDDLASGDTFWKDEARNLLTVLMAHVASDPRFEGRRTFHTIYEILTAGEDELADKLKTAGEKDVPDGFQLLFGGMELNPFVNGYVQKNAKAYRGLYERARKTWEGVVGQAKSVLHWLASPAMQRIMEKSDFSFSDLKTNPNGTSVYLCVRSMRTHSRWIKLLFRLMQLETENTFPVATGHKTLCVLDEFSSLKKMTEIHDLLDKGAGMGFRLCIVVQRMSQLINIYGQHGWEGFYSAADLRIFGRMDEPTTQKFVSGQLGETEISRLTRGFSQSHSVANSISQSHSIANGTSNTRTIGGSHTDGWSDQRSQSISSNKTQGDSTSVSQNSSIADTHGQGTSESRGGQKGSSASKSENSGHTMAVKETLFGGLTLDRGPRAQRTYNFGTGTGLSTNQGTNWNFGASTNSSKTFNQGQAITNGSNNSVSDGVTDGSSVGTSGSTTRSTSDAIGATHTDTATTGSSRTETDGQSASVNETIHKRALVPHYELSHLTYQVKKPSDPRFPGQALVMLGDGINSFVRTTHYFDDPMFYQCFSSHPEHGFQQTPTPWSVKAALITKEKAIDRHLSRLADEQWEVYAAKQRAIAHRNKQRVDVLNLDARSHLLKTASKSATVIRGLEVVIQVEHATIYGLQSEFAFAEIGYKKAVFYDQQVETDDPILKLPTGQVLVRAPCSAKVRVTSNRKCITITLRCSDDLPCEHIRRLLEDAEYIKNNVPPDDIPLLQILEKTAAARPQWDKNFQASFNKSIEVRKKWLTTRATIDTVRLQNDLAKYRSTKPTFMTSFQTAASLFEGLPLIMFGISLLVLLGALAFLSQGKLLIGLIFSAPAILMAGYFLYAPAWVGERYKALHPLHSDYSSRSDIPKSVRLQMDEWKASLEKIDMEHVQIKIQN